MTPWFPRPKQPWQLSRRRFVQGLAAGGVLAATPSWLQAAVKGATALGSVVRKALGARPATRVTG